MRMKLVVTLFLFMQSCLMFGQVNPDYAQLSKDWTGGKIDQDNVVTDADVSRGGNYNLKLNSDSTVVLSDPFYCGFGYERQGKWTLDTENNSLIFNFSVSRGYAMSPGTMSISETENYKITKITPDELILVQDVNGQEKILPFIRTKK